MNGLRLRLGTWAELQALASPLRTEVFVHEQGVPPELEWDADDAQAVHAVVLDAGGQVLATGRLLVHAPGVGRIGRMAVRRTHRGQGLGAQVLQSLMQAARARGDGQVLLHAQCSAQRFYERAGFVPEGAVYQEAGIAHITMRCGL